MGSVLEYRVANNYEEYLKICIETFTDETKEIPFSLKKEKPLEGVDEWTDFFGIYEFRDEKYDDVEDWEEIIRHFKGEMDLRPDESEFPVLVTYCFEDRYDRYGTSSSQLWDWVSLSKIGLERKKKVKR